MTHSWPTADGRLSGRIGLDGRELIMLSSNDYLGLAGDERVVAGARRALDTHGTGIGLNPSIALTRVHRGLADELADYLGAESVLLFAAIASSRGAGPRLAASWLAGAFFVRSRKAPAASTSTPVGNGRISASPPPFSAHVSVATVD